MNKIHVVGIGYKPLNEEARACIDTSDVILASGRLFEVFKGYGEFEQCKNRIKVLNNIDETLGFIRDNHASQRITLLASGDPLFFGIGRRVLREFGKDAVEIIPELSSIQTAFARIKEPWDDAFLMSLHGGPDPSKRRRLEYTPHDIPRLLKEHGAVAVLTDTVNSPVAIAKELLPLQSPIAVYVCERLGYADEKITEGTPEEIAAGEFGQPNVVIIKSKTEARKDESAERRLGLTESDILHSRGLITKDEVRAVTLHKLELPSAGVFWDIGAGSGSVSIEAARLCPELKVFGVERDKEQIENIRNNKARFGVTNIEVIEGVAPEALKDLPAPDRVFIGGSGGELADIVRLCAERMTCGIIVVNAATIETLNEAIGAFRKANLSTDIAQIAVSRMKEIGKGNYFSPLNPVFIIKGEA